MSLKNYCFTGIPHLSCSQNPSSSTTKACSADFATQNCSEHSFYCFTGVPTPGCSQTPSSYTQMPISQLLQRKTAASTRFTVSQEYRTPCARRTPSALHQCPFRSFCNAKLQRALVLLFHRCSNARVLADPLAIHQCPFRSFCVSKTAASTRFTVSPEYRTSCARIPRTPQVAKSMLR